VARRRVRRNLTVRSMSVERTEEVKGVREREESRRTGEGGRGWRGEGEERAAATRHAHAYLDLINPTFRR